MNTNRRQAIASASMQAARLHQTLQTPYDRPVDVFMLAQRLGLWLVAQPLEKAFGFYLREEQAAGVVVNSQHPETLQRFTCAHEIGHHLLGHASHTDDASTLQRMSDLALQEHQAQVFAAALLMPGPLVNRTLHRLGVTSRLRPADIYAASRDMAVSYTAALWGLTALGKINTTTAADLARKGPRPAKDALRGGPSLTDPRADIWVLDDSADNTTVRCRVGDEIHIRLAEDLSTGHVWTLDDPSDPAISRPVESADALWWDGGSELDIRRTDTPILPAPPTAPLEFSYNAHLDADGSPSLDQPSPEEQFLFTPDAAAPSDSGDEPDFTLPPAGTRVLIVRPRETGAFQIRLTLRPAWDTSAAPASTRLFILRAIPRKTLPERGCAAPQIDLRAQQLGAA
jgi:Zn-dependent peptidase ImmA (M78 family)